MTPPRSRPATGKVILVGAGPGDPELMTIRAMRALLSADVILYDDLVNPQILDWAPPTARRIPVGKRGGCRSTPQAFILKLAAAEARRGNTVVRLKGGDPMLFGRGGEEWQALSDQGIRVEVVNGISAGLAAATAIGVPLTHRDHASGVILVTGHGKDGNEPRWSALAATGLTLVVYMGMARVAHIRDRLLEAGMRPAMPVAVVRNATLCNVAAVRTTLARLPDAIAEAGLSSPAIIVIGDVVDLATALSSVAPATEVATSAGARDA
jgi:uroporphyrin-III C-methyltransferase